MTKRLEELVKDLHTTTNHDEAIKNLVNCLMNEYCIVAGESKFRVLECEVYYFDVDKHEDIFAYKLDKQVKTLQWFFHYSGIDITIGNKSGIKGGILIRTIEALDADAKEKTISGPLKSSNHILNAAHNECVRGEGQSSSLYLQECMYQDKQEPFRTIRIGLDKGKILEELDDIDGKAVKYHDRQYRFVHQSFMNDKKCTADKERNEKRLKEISEIHRRGKK